MPRPPRSGEAATVLTVIRMTPTERRDLETVARENRTTIGGVLRDAANEYVADYRERPVFGRRNV